MPVSSVSFRLFPAFYGGNLRVEPSGRPSDTEDDHREAVVTLRTRAASTESPPTEATEVVDALLEALDDAELEALEELDTEDIEVLARQLQLRGVRRRHARGFLNVPA